MTERLDFKSLNIFFTKPRQQLKLDLFQMQSGCFVSLCKFQSNCKIITGIAAGEKNDYYSLKCILIINHHPILHNTSHLVLKVYCPSFILHQQSYNNLASKSFFSIFSCSCVTLPTEWTWVSYRAPRTVGLLPVDCWKEQPVAFCTFTRTLPHRYWTWQPFQQSMMPPTGFLGRQATERCGRPGLMTQQTASAFF